MKQALAVLFVLGACACPEGTGAGLAVRGLRCEYRVDPLGIDAVRPRLSWVLDSDRRGELQSAWQVLVALAPQNLEPGKADLWDSGKVASDQSVHVIYGGRPVRSGERAHWKVSVWGRDGATATSAPSWWEMGLLSPDDWKAQWIGLRPEAPSGAPKLVTKDLKWIWFPEGNPAEKAPAGPRYFRRTIDLPAAPKRALFILTADDQFTLRVNNKDAGKGTAWSQFETVDVKEFLKTGANTVTVTATNGGENPAGLIGQLRIEFESGEPLVVSTDKAWQASRKKDLSDADSAMEIAAFGEAGAWDTAYTLLLNETFPSWGYSIKHGATTIWERWDGWTAEKGFQDPGMNSFNHYSFGSVGEWMYAHIAGIDLDPVKPGYKHIRIRPRPGGGLTWARGSLESMYGRISTDWRIEGRTFTLKVIIPANTTATVTLPFGGGAKEIGSGTCEFTTSIP